MKSEYEPGEDLPVVKLPLIGFVYEDSRNIEYHSSIGVPNVGEIIEQFDLLADPVTSQKWIVKSREWQLTHNSFNPVLHLKRLP